MLDFDYWLESEGPIDDAIDLRNAIRSEESVGRYTVDREDCGLVVQGESPIKLILASDEAKNYFLQIIHQKYIAKRRPRSRDS